MNYFLQISLIFVFISDVLTQNDQISSLEQFVAKLLAGIELTATYTITLGNDYPPIDQDVTFWCVSPRKTNLVQTFLNDSDIKSKIDFQRPVNFLIHGWLGGLNGGNMYLPANVREEDGWMQPTSINWTMATNCNVCSVDWSRLANYEYAVAALKNTKLVTAFIIQFMDFLIANGMQLPQVTIAGHSLGGQIAGFIGRNYRGELRAIYGLDPAGPGFTIPFDLGPGTRLDKSCARYVQCVHTSRGTLGTLLRCGHGDFIVNGGFIQPGCSESLFCSHARSHEYFNEALRRQNIFCGVKSSRPILDLISSIFEAPRSRVDDRLGIYNKRKNGSFYLNTNAQSPYAIKNRSCLT